MKKQKPEDRYEYLIRTGKELETENKSYESPIEEREFLERIVGETAKDQERIKELIALLQGNMKRREAWISQNKEAWQQASDSSALIGYLDSFYAAESKFDKLFRSKRGDTIEWINEIIEADSSRREKRRIAIRNLGYNKESLAEEVKDWKRKPISIKKHWEYTFTIPREIITERNSNLLIIQSESESEQMVRNLRRGLNFYEEMFPTAEEINEPLEDYLELTGYTFSMNLPEAREFKGKLELKVMTAKEVEIVISLQNEEANAKQIDKMLILARKIYDTIGPIEYSRSDLIIAPRDLKPVANLKAAFTIKDTLEKINGELIGYHQIPKHNSDCYGFMIKFNTPKLLEE